jgi:hypothetical protein
MVQWNNLPIEILDIVFDIIRNRKRTHRGRVDLSQCELTCRGWRLPAQRALLYSVHLTDVRLTQNLIDFITSTGLGKLTRSLYYNLAQMKNQGKYFQHDIYLKIFAVYFPFLEQLDTLKQKYAFYSRAINSQNQWKYLKRIAEPTRGKDVLIYVECALTYRRNLTHLLLCEYIPDPFFYKDETKIALTTEYNLLDKRLAEFTHLTHLRVFKYSTNNLLVHDLDYVIDSCNSLKSLQFTIRPHLDTTIIHIYPPTTGATLIAHHKHMLSIKQSHHIKDANMKCWMDNDFALYYIMRKFPSLDTFTFRDGRYNKPDINRNNPTPLILGQFLSFARNSPTHFVDVSVTVNMVADTLYTYWQSSAHRPPQKTTIRQSKFRNGSDGYAEIQLMSKGNTIRLVEVEGLCIIYHGNNEFVQASRQEFLKKTGKWIMDLEVEFQCHDDDNDKLVNSVFTHCTRLDTLILNGVYYTLDLGSCNIKSNSIRHLTITNALTLDKIFPQLSSLLPNLKTLILNYVYREKAPKYRTIDMPYTAFDELHYGAIGSNQCSIERYYIELSMHDVKKYYLCERKSANNPVQIQASDSLYQSMIDDNQCVVISVRCHWITKFTLRLFPVCFLITNKSSL